MKRFLRKYYRIILALLCVSMLIGTAVWHYRENSGLKLPDCDFVYDEENFVNEYELDDYELFWAAESEQYKLRDKKTGAVRRLFNDPFSTRINHIHSIVTYGNRVYYGSDNTFYCYDADTDTTTTVYSLVNKPVSIELFDVRVFYRAVSRDEIETQVLKFIISDGNLIIGTDRDIRKFDGKDTKVLLKGRYYIRSYRDGVLKLQKYYFDEEGNETAVWYEYDIDGKELKKI